MKESLPGILRAMIRALVPRAIRAWLLRRVDNLDRLLALLSPQWRIHRKYREELAFWRNELAKLRAWYRGTSPAWYGIPAPAEEQKVKSGRGETLDLVRTLNAVNPDYLRKLSLSADYFAGKKVLDIGCGPLAPSQQFTGAEHHLADALLERYVASGWPMKEYGMTLTTCHAEHLAYPDGFFDAVLSVNALDHVDDFEAAAAEIERVVKPGGGIYMEVEYHEPRELEPQKLSDGKVLAAFARTDLRKVSEKLRQSGIHGREGDAVALWHGTRREGGGDQQSPSISRPGTIG